MFNCSDSSPHILIKYKITLEVVCFTKITPFIPFFRLSWFSPPAWKSYRATNSWGSSSSCVSRSSLDVHRLAVSNVSGVEGATEPDDPESVPKLLDAPKVTELIEFGGSDSGRLGMCGSGLLCNRASERIEKKHFHYHVDIMLLSVFRFLNISCKWEHSFFKWI